MSEQEPLPLADEVAQAEEIESAAMLQALAEARRETGDDDLGRIEAHMLGGLAYHLAQTPEGRKWWDESLQNAVEHMRARASRPEPTTEDVQLPDDEETER